MSDQSRPSVPKWPFFLADALMLALAWFVQSQSRRPLDAFAIVAIGVCVALGAFVAILPFLLDYRVALKLAETGSLGRVVDQIRNLEAIGAQITQATSQWTSVQEHSSKTATIASELGERMTAEAKAFAEFMQKANDAEKGNLRLEVDKLRRAENDWLQVVVRMLDHTYALYTAAGRTGKTPLNEQLTQFQNALRDAARRVGLVPFTPSPGESFDATKHQAADSEKPTSNDTVRETVATGYTFRGQMVRPALVTVVAPQLETANAETATPPSAAATPVEQTLL
jgi:molecular chaperone GrpE (heat shock protein)